jgi:hypothetical protein
METNWLKFMRDLFRRDNKPKRLYFDDERTGPIGWITVRPAQIQFYIDLIVKNKNHRIEAISFDHDLGFDEHGEEYPSGYKFFCQLEEAYYSYGIIPPMIYVHSANPAGSGNIMRGIESLNRRLGVFYNPQVLPVYGEFSC